MRKDPKRSSQKDISRISNSTPRQSTPSAQHGQHSSPLLLLPSESLTHITSFLDPVSLCCLAQTSRKLCEHVSDDNTWRRAFVCQSLGVSPENALNEVKSLTFRLTQKTWRHECIRRHMIRGQWSRSKNTAISHRPLHAQISVIHVTAEYGLLSASTKYGVVARSLPFRNKVLKGYLYANGMPPGLGTGFPNTDFTPEITTCVLTSDGTTAQMLWGRRDGSIIVVFHPRTMSGTQAPARIHTSSVRQEHEGAVLDGAWSANGDAFVTAGSDRRIKVWTVTPFRCAWTSERHLLEREADAISKVVEDLGNGVVVAASRSGDVIVMSGFDVSSLGTGDAPLRDVQKLCFPVRPSPVPDVEPASNPHLMEISTLLIQVSSPTKLSILACYRSTSQFYRCSVDLVSEQVDIKTFGDAAFGTIRCIQPVLSNDPAESSFVITGTHLGIISIYDWDATSLSSDSFLASRHVDVFSDAHVTSLAVNPFVIVAGSSRGTIIVLDLLTFETLRSFRAPTNNDVLQIELAGDVLVANVGSKVLAWSAAHFGSGGKNPLKIKGKGKQGGHGKWFRHAELRSDISESTNIAEESSPLQRSLGPEREQLMQLRTLGLSEREAVEYTLMLSRDEELQRLQGCTNGHVLEEGMFDNDEGSRSGSGSDHSSLSSSSVRQYSPPPLRSSLSGSSISSHGHISIASPSSSNIKVQVSPRFYPEPKEAGGVLSSPSNSQSVPPQESSPSAPSRSYPQSNPGPSTPLVITPTPKQVRTGIGMSSGKPNAWSKPLPGTGLSASPPVPSRHPLPDWEAEVERIREVEDVELRFALELSLAEAQSREREKNAGGTW